MPHPLAQYLDFANHHANAAAKDIEELATNVKTYGFHAAFVNPVHIQTAKKTGVRVGTVISFPLGQDTQSQKEAAVNEAVRLGADELDVVPNIAPLVTGDAQTFSSELKSIVDSARMVGAPVIVKFILDPGFFTPEQLAQAAKLIEASGADFVKVGSGMGPRIPTLKDIQIVKEAVPGMKIKVAGGIDTLEEAQAFIKAGVTRIGTSHAIAIVTKQSPPQSPTTTSHLQE